MSNVVEILVKGTDKSKPAFDSAEKGASRFGDATDGAKKKLGLLGVAAGAVAGVGLAKFFMDSNAEARESQKVNAQTAAVLKSTGGAANVTADQIGKLSTSISNKTGIDDEQIQSSANMLLTFTNVRNEVGKGNDVFNQATQVVTDMSVALGQDSKNSAIQLGKALNDPIKGITALQRVGVSFTTQQKDQIKTLVTSGHTLDAQKIILKELTKEFGGSAAAQATSGDKLKTAFKNVEESVGTALLPVLDFLANFLTQRVLPAFSATVAWVVSHWPQIRDTIVSIWNNYIKPVLMALVNFMTNTVIPGIRNVVQWVVAHWPQISAALATVWANIKPVLMSFISMLKTLWQSVLLPIVEWVKAHWPQISAVMKVVFVAIAVAVKIMLVAVKLSFDSMAVGIRVFAAVVRWLWSSIISPTFSVIKTAISGVSRAFQAIGNGLQWAWKNVVSPYIKAIKDLVHGAIKIVSTAVSGVSNAFKSIGNGLIWAWNHTIGPVVNGILSAIQAVQDAYDRLTTKVVSGKGTEVKPGGHSKVLFGPGGVGSGILGHASGGVAGGEVRVDEQGGEIIRLPQGSMVYPHGQVPGGGGGSPTVIQLEINSGGSKIDDLLVELIRKAIRIRGGNVQIALGA